jgi:SAM-dependent methyltransferase
MQPDQPIDSAKLFGVDVALTRTDDLDKLLLVDISESDDLSVLDLGCGQGGQSLRMAAAGARVVGVDVHNHNEVFRVYREQNNIPESSLRFIQGDVQHYASLTELETFDICCLQRMIHYVPHAQAKQLLTQLKETLAGTLYISVTGIESEIGRVYSDTQKPVAERFCCLEKDAMETFSITEPICLYTQVEFVELLASAGWRVEKVWTSAFGNHKAVCC